MADLFDMKAGGLGFHITAHIIAIAALFVACFAITGYISFRDDSVPGDALKDHDVDLDDVKLTSIDHNGSGVEKMYSLTLDGAIALRSGIDRSLGTFGITLPVGAVIKQAYVRVDTVTNTDLGQLAIESGTSAECAFDGTPELNVLAGPANSTTVATLYGSNLDVSVATGDQDLCISAANATATTSGKIIAGVKVFFPPGVTPV